MNTATEVKRAITRIANMVLNGGLDPKQANTILYGCNIILSAIRTDEQEKRMDELEKALEEIEGRDHR